MLPILSVAAVAGVLPAQTTVDLHSQTRNVDFSNAAATKVWKTGASLPASCNLGEGFFLTTTQNLYLCAGSGTWKIAGPAPVALAGTGGTAQSVSGTFAPNSVPVVDATSTQVSSGCTATAGAMTCSAGFSGGTGATRITASEGGQPAAPPAGEQTLYLDSADHNLKSLDSGNIVRQYATLNGMETLGSKTLVSPSLGGSALTSTFSNEGSTGTVLGKLAKLTGNPALAILAAKTDTGGIVGIVTAGAGTSGTAEIATAGQASCVFDGGTTAGDYVSISSTIAGDCHDGGSTYPSTGQILGRVLSTNAAGGSYSVSLFGPEVQGAAQNSGAGGAFDPFDQTTAWVRDEMLTNNQWSLYAENGGSLVAGDGTYGDAQHPGVFQLTTGSATGNLIYMWLAWPNGGQVMHYPVGLVWEMQWVVKLNSLTTSTYEFGFMDSGPHNEVKIAYSQAAGPNWRGVSRNADTETGVDLGVAATTSAWAKIRMRSDGTKVYFSVNGNSEQSICPAGCSVSGSFGVGYDQIWPYALVSTQANTWTSMGIDFFAMKITGLTR
jgi:hypothetical protein